MPDYKVIILPEARLELLDAFAWYQEQQEGLGFDFKLCIDEVVSALERNPNIYKPVHGDVRRALVRRFPFGIFFFVENKNVIILAVLHARRDPAHWKGRM